MAENDILTKTGTMPPLAWVDPATVIAADGPVLTSLTGVPRWSTASVVIAASANVLTVYHDPALSHNRPAWLPLAVMMALRDYVFWLESPRDDTTSPREAYGVYSDPILADLAATVPTGFLSYDDDPAVPPQSAAPGANRICSQGTAVLALDTLGRLWFTSTNNVTPGTLVELPITLSAGGTINQYCSGVNTDGTTWWALVEEAVLGTGDNAGTKRPFACYVYKSTVAAPIHSTDWSLAYTAIAPQDGPPIYQAGLYNNSPSVIDESASPGVDASLVDSDYGYAWHVGGVPFLTGFNYSMPNVGLAFYPSTDPDFPDRVKTIYLRSVYVRDGWGTIYGPYSCVIDTPATPSFEGSQDPDAAGLWSFFLHPPGSPAPDPPTAGPYPSGNGIDFDYTSGIRFLQVDDTLKGSNTGFPEQSVTASEWFAFPTGSSAPQALGPGGNGSALVREGGIDGTQTWTYKSAAGLSTPVAVGWGTNLDGTTGFLTNGFGRLSLQVYSERVKASGDGTFWLGNNGFTPPRGPIVDHAGRLDNFFNNDLQGATGDGAGGVWGTYDSGKLWKRSSALGGWTSTGIRVWADTRTLYDMSRSGKYIDWLTSVPSQPTQLQLFQGDSDTLAQVGADPIPATGTTPSATTSDGLTIIAFFCDCVNPAPGQLATLTAIVDHDLSLAPYTRWNLIIYDDLGNDLGYQTTNVSLWFDTFTVGQTVTYHAQLENSSTHEVVATDTITVTGTADGFGGMTMSIVAHDPIDLAPDSVSAVSSYSFYGNPTAPPPA